MSKIKFFIHLFISAIFSVCMFGGVMEEYGRYNTPQEILDTDEHTSYTESRNKQMPGSLEAQLENIFQILESTTYDGRNLGAIVGVVNLLPCLLPCLQLQLLSRTIG